MPPRSKKRKRNVDEQGQSSGGQRVTQLEKVKRSSKKKGSSSVTRKVGPSKKAKGTSKDKSTRDQVGHQEQQCDEAVSEEDNPIIIKQQSQQLVPAAENFPVSTETAMSLMNENFPGAVVQAYQSQSLQPSEMQETSVEVKGGNYERANFGPTSMSAYRNVGIAGANFSGASIGPTYHSTVINKYFDSGSENEQFLCQKHGKGCSKLTESICLFTDRKLSTAPKSRVYEGVQSSEVVGDQPLAIKLVFDFTKINQREAKNLVKLRPHTNVVTIRHADVCKKQPVKCMFIAMERCDTVNLEIYIENRKKINLPFNVKETFDHCMQIINAIHHIHDNGILHRDLKPCSVLFSLCRKFLKICDFGLSKELKDGHSVLSLSMLKLGTDGYRAPETYNKNSITKMADIFSLGLVLYHLMSYGFHPFGLDPDEWNSNIKKGQNLKLSRLRAPFLEIANDLLKKMLNLTPEERPSIEVVRNEFMKLDWVSSLTKNLVEIWNGTVKDKTGVDVLPCQIYCSPTEKEIIKMDEMDWKFQVDTIKFLNISGLKKVTEEEPSGYIVTSSSAEVNKLIQKLTKNNLMAWITISNKGEKEKVIALLCYPGYQELFGFFLPNREAVTSVVGSLVPMQDKEELKRAAGQGSSSMPMNVPTSDAKLSTTQMEQSPVTEDADLLEAARGNADDDYVKDDTNASTRSQLQQDLTTDREFIPWWIITGN